MTKIPLPRLSTALLPCSLLAVGAIALTLGWPGWSPVHAASCSVSQISVNGTATTYVNGMQVPPTNDANTLSLCPHTSPSTPTSSPLPSPAGSGGPSALACQFSSLSHTSGSQSTSKQSKGMQTPVGTLWQVTVSTPTSGQQDQAMLSFQPDGTLSVQVPSSTQPDGTDSIQQAPAAAAATGRWCMTGPHTFHFTFPEQIMQNGQSHVLLAQQDAYLTKNAFEAAGIEVASNLATQPSLFRVITLHAVPAVSSASPGAQGSGVISVPSTPVIPSPTIGG